MYLCVYTLITRVATHRYYSNTEAYLKAVALKRMPPNLQTVDMLKAGDNPPLSPFVFWKHCCRCSASPQLLYALMRSQFLSLVWTPLCSCGPKSSRRTSWLSLKRTTKGEVHPPEVSGRPPLGGSVAYLPLLPLRGRVDTQNGLTFA